MTSQDTLAHPGSVYITILCKCMDVISMVINTMSYITWTSEQCTQADGSPLPTPAFIAQVSAKNEPIFLQNSNSEVYKKHHQTFLLDS